MKFRGRLLQVCGSMQIRHSGPQGGSKRAREFGRGGKGKGKGKNKGKGKGREGGKGKRTTLLVQKKGVRFANLKEEGSSSMMVRDNEDVSEDEGGVQKQNCTT